MIRMYQTIRQVLTDYQREDIVLAQHVADPHLGYNCRPSKFDEYKAIRIDKTINGHNVRTLDVNDAFQQTIDIALEFGKDFLEQPGVDIYLNAGDGFDTYGFRTNFIENFYTKQYLRLTKADIPIVEIVGNHNFPREAGIGCHLERISFHDNIHAVYKGRYEPLTFENLNLVVHCVPSTFNQQILNAELEKARPIEGRINVGLGHWGVSSIKHYVQSAENSLVVDLDSVIRCNMHYFALGDYHKAMDLGNNIHYAGSIERLGFGEIDNKPQVNIVAFNKKTGEVLCIEPVFLHVRPMIRLEVDAKGKTIEEVNHEVVRTIQSKDLTDAIVILKIFDLKTEHRRLIDRKEIKELMQEALDYKLDIQSVDSRKEFQPTNQSMQVGIVEGFPAFAKKIPCDGSYNQEEMINEALNLLKGAFDDED